MPRTGRPKIEINQQVFEGLCRIHCTLEEIAGVLDASVDTIERWCKATYKQRFAEVFRQKAANGKMSLRRAQVKLAESGNATMLIWLGKNILGQRDEVHNYNIDLTPLTDEQLEHLAAGEDPHTLTASSGSNAGVAPPLTSERIN